MRAFKDIDRSYPARRRRTEEFRTLGALPYRNKEQEGRYVWLKRQKKIDATRAWKEECEGDAK